MLITNGNILNLKSLRKRKGQVKKNRIQIQKGTRFAPKLLKTPTSRRTSFQNKHKNGLDFFV